MKSAIVIPARYGSTRFPGKPLALIAGRTMLARVVDVARKAAGPDRDIPVVVATEDERIRQHCGDIGVRCFITPESCRTGSDRVLAALQKMDEQPDFVVNLQGDAPFTPPSAVQALLDAFANDPSLEVVTPVHRLGWDELDALRAAKKTTPFSGTTAILAPDHRSLWFSKNILPAIRKEEKMRASGEPCPVWRHLGLYGFRRDVLERFCTLPPSFYEELEGLEQLRLIENGIRVQAVPVFVDGGSVHSGIDSPEDLARAEKALTGA